MYYAMMSKLLPTSMTMDKVALHTFVCISVRLYIARGMGHLPLWATPYAAAATAAVAIGFLYAMSVKEGDASILNAVSDRATKWWRNWRVVHAILWGAAATMVWAPWLNVNVTDADHRRQAQAHMRSLGFAEATLMLDVCVSVVSKQWVRHPDDDYTPD
jgi:hypothetical protein